MAGAVALAGMACLRSGSGLVKLAVPDCVLETVAGFEPSYMTAPLRCDEAGRLNADAAIPLLEMAESVTCVACGPGIGRSSDLTYLVRELYRRLPMPMVIDADGLNALAEAPAGLKDAAGPRVLTPHPGEFSRLSGVSAASRLEQIQAARKLADERGVVIVLKGHRTFITDGSREAVNATGNPGMATGGTGDVLTGIITALICQGLAAFDAAVLGVHIHGLAGDLAAKELGQASLIARDLVGFLPAAFCRQRFRV
jgi:ADP-dependent NAD(P)H-hydrate dehydratase